MSKCCGLVVVLCLGIPALILSIYSMTGYSTGPKTTALASWSALVVKGKDVAALSEFPLFEPLKNEDSDLSDDDTWYSVLDSGFESVAITAKPKEGNLYADTVKWKDMDAICPKGDDCDKAKTIRSINGFTFAMLILSFVLILGSLTVGILLFTAMNTAMMKWIAVSLTGTATLFLWLALIVYVATVPSDLKKFMEAALEDAEIKLGDDPKGVPSIGWWITLVLAIFQTAWFIAHLCMPLTKPKQAEAAYANQSYQPQGQAAIQMTPQAQSNGAGMPPPPPQQQV